MISSQVAVTPGHDELGGIPGTHVDGGWSGKIPQLQTKSIFKLVAQKMLNAILEKT